MEEEKLIKKTKENNSSQNKNIRISKILNSEKFINILEQLRLTQTLMIKRRGNKLKNGKRS